VRLSVEVAEEVVVTVVIVKPIVTSVIAVDILPETARTRIGVTGNLYI
jgi:hypothetical protein